MATLIKASHRNARIAPRKIRPLARILRGLSVISARDQLRYAPSRKAGDLLTQVMQSAVANAKSKLDIAEKDLIVSEVVVDGGAVFHRHRPVSRGSANEIRKRMSHITVVLSGKTDAKLKQPKSAKAAITTISAEEFTKQQTAAEAETSQRKRQVSLSKKDEGETGTADAEKDKALQAYDKKRMLQGGGDKKKSFRRKSV